MENPNNNDLTRGHMLPRFFYSHRSLLLAWLLPQAVLFAAGLFFYWLLRDEIGAEKLVYIRCAGAIQAVTLILGVFFAFYPKRRLGAIESLAFLLYFMGYFFLNGWLLIEGMPSHSEWILNPLTVFLMETTPIILTGIYFAIRLAAFEWKVTFKRDILTSSIAAVLALGIFYLAYLLSLSALAFHLPSFLRTASIVSFLIFIMLVTAVFSVFSIRFVILLYAGTAKARPVLKYLVYAVFGLLLPVASLLYLYLGFRDMGLGKALESMVSDFGFALVLAIVNGILLFVPVSKLWNSGKYALLLGTAAVFPFVAYVAFLFVPLVPFAMFTLIFGFGFVLITPFVMFMMSLARISEICGSMTGNLKIAAVTLGMLLLPGYIVVESLIVRNQINLALDYVENPDTSASREFAGSRKSSLKALDWIAAYKQDFYIPYITPLRINILTNGMVLQDKKIDRMRYMLAGENPAERPSKYRHNTNGAFTNFSQANYGYARFETKILDSIEENARDNPEILKFSLTLENQKWGLPEAGCGLTLSEGLFICGMNMDVNGMEKKASFIEKRAAIWTYEQITNERKDPSIVYYINLNDLILRVSPLGKGESKRITLSLLPPPNFEGSTLDYRAKASEDMQSGTYQADALITGKTRSIVAASSKSASYVLIKNDGEEFHVFERKPYWALTVDVSRNPELLWNEQVFEEKTAAALAMLHSKNPEITRARVYASSLNFAPVYNAEYNGSKWELTNIGCKVETMNMGGFDYDLSYLFVMADYAGRAENAAKLRDFPIPVFLSDSKSAFNPTDAFKEFVPELGKGYAVMLGSSGDFRVMNAICEPDFETPPFSENIKVSHFSMNGEFRIAPSGISAMTFNSAFDPQKFHCYDCEKSAISNTGVELAAGDSRWSKAALLRHDDIMAKRNPALLNDRLKDIAEKSKALEVVTSVTSAIIVETSTQEKAMKLAEMQAVNSNNALEFQEDDGKTNMPEPPLWACALLGASLLGLGKTKRLFQKKGRA